MATDFSKFFTTYEATEPPPIKTSTYLEAPIIENPDYIPEYKSADTEYVLSDTNDFPTFSVDFFSTKKEDSDSKVDNIIDLARSFVGTKYQWGGSKPSTGFDCSGLVNYVFGEFGVKLPRKASLLAKTGKEVSIEDAQVGDLVCTNTHVKIISKIEDGLIYTIDARGKKYGVIETPLTKLTGTIRRVLNTETTSFDSKKDYALTMYNHIYNALENNGIDGDEWAPILVALTALESAWGNEFSRKNNNFAGIKGKGSGTVTTKEYTKDKGYYKVKSSFKSFDSIDDFADEYVKLLKNRYKVFDDSPSNYVRNLKAKGYFTASLTDYSKLMNSILNRVNTYLS